MRQNSKTFTQTHRMIQEHNHTIINTKIYKHIQIYKKVYVHTQTKKNNKTYIHSLKHTQSHTNTEAKTIPTHNDTHTYINKLTNTD